MCQTPPYTREKMKTNKTKNNTICVRHHHTQEKRQRQTKQKTQHNMCQTPPYTREKNRQTKQKTQHNMCQTPPYTREKMKTNKTKNTTQYVLDTTIHKRKDEDKQNKQHNTICVRHHHTQEKR